MKFFKHATKTTGLAALALSLSLGFVSNARASKLVILTDEPGGIKAKAIRSFIQASYPFKLLKSSELTIQVQILDPNLSKIECHPHVVKYTDKEIESVVYWAKEGNHPMSDADVAKYRKGFTIDRLVECDQAALAQAGARFQADHMLFVRQSEFEGGSGGSVPIILSGSRVGIGLHEWIHTFGFADEYAYTSAEAVLYCGKKEFANVAVFEDAPPYSSSDDVRTRHGAQIPWMPYLPRNVVLETLEQLGTPMQGRQAASQTGLFLSQTCDNLKPKMKSWKPTPIATIMQDPQTNFVPQVYWPPILSGLGVTESRITALMKLKVKVTFSQPTDFKPKNVKDGGSI